MQGQCSYCNNSYPLGHMKRSGTFYWVCADCYFAYRFSDGTMPLPNRQDSPIQWPSVTTTTTTGQ